MLAHKISNCIDFRLKIINLKQPWIKNKKMVFLLEFREWIWSIRNSIHCWGMVVFTFICCHNRAWIVWWSLHMFTHITVGICASVIASAITVFAHSKSWIRKISDTISLLHYLINMMMMIYYVNSSTHLGNGFPLTTFWPYFRHRKPSPEASDSNVGFCIPTELMIPAGVSSILLQIFEFN